MRNMLIGGISIIGGIILFCFTFVATATYSSQLYEWDSRYGKFGTALLEMSLIPMFVSIALAGIGIVFILKEEKTT
ncbi:hypothetical protein [Bacillus sp. CGMCC 1.16541]|uniref:hypothetical protein n=1 Tax=Bacillus sp. CGMCC 1.16541 TaxID=2185143 RepID=UPI000D72E302|nr:hypothetical protein [Bacillus sp. CGMCC 1.16541]